MKSDSHNYLYNKMKENAITDIMTGVSNRNGFNIIMPKLIEDAKNTDNKILVLMGDLNGLKYINDNFGHNEGDKSIRKAAELLENIKIKNAEREEVFRMGGDEFVKVAIGEFDNASAELIKQEIYAAFNNYNNTSRMPYPVYLSLGYYIKEEQKDIAIDKILSAADENMYVEKQRLKKETGFDPKRK